jgi:hypothetical protein
MEVGPDATVVFFHVTDWEEQNGENLFSSFYDWEDGVLMLARIGKALKHDSPPDRATLPEDFALFVLNEMIEYAADTGVNNIKSIIKVQDRNSIADACALSYATAESSWPSGSLWSARGQLNEIFKQDDIGQGG